MTGTRRPRRVRRFLPVCGFEGCLAKSETYATAEKARAALLSHVISQGHVTVKPVIVERQRVVIEERIVG